MSRSPLHRLCCACGSKLEAQSQPPDAATPIVDWWRARHTGPGHAMTDAATARRTRVKADAETAVAEYARLSESDQ